MSESEKKRKYIRGAILTSGSKFVGIAASLATMTVALRVIEKPEMGAYFLLLVVSQFAVSMGDLGLRSTSVRYLSAAKPDEFESIASFLWGIRLVSCVLTGAVMLLLSPVFTRIWPDEQFKAVVLYIGPISALMLFTQMGTAVLIGYRLFRYSSFLHAGVELLRMLLSVVFIFMGWGIIGLIYAIIIADIAGILLIFRLTPHKIRFRYRHPAELDILKFGGWLHGSSILSVIMVRAGDAILTSYLGTSALAVYAAAMQIPSLLRKFFESIRPVLLGYLSQLHEGSKSAITSVRLIGGLLAVFSAFLIVFGGPVLVLFFSDRYKDSVEVMQVLSVWSVVGSINYLFTLILIGAGKSKEVFWVSLIQVFIAISLNLLLVPRFFEMGAAGALLVTSLFSNFVAIEMIASSNKMLLRKELWLVYCKTSTPLIGLLIGVWLFPVFYVNVILFIIALTVLFSLKTLTVNDFNMLWSCIFKRPVIKPML